MASYIPHDKPHAEAGKWARSMWVWHLIKWDVSGDGQYLVDAASFCDRYLEEPYLSAPPVGAITCQKCAKASE